MAESVETLVLRAQRGDRRALQLLLERYRPLLGRAVGEVVRLGGQAVGPVDRADLFQEGVRILIELIRAYDPGRGVGLSYYLQRNLRWRLYNFLRRERWRLGREVPLREGNADAVVDPAAEPQAEGVSPRLERALKKLSRKQRWVLFLTYWQDRSVEEVARILKVKPRAVWALRRRAEDRLRSILDAPDGP